MWNHATTLTVSLTIASLFDITTSAFTPQILPSSAFHPTTTTTPTSSHHRLCARRSRPDPTGNHRDDTKDAVVAIDRRDAVARSVSTVLQLCGTVSVVVGGLPLGAGAYPQEATDRENVVKGYRRLSYLLDNWEKETVICGRSDNPYVGCERQPEKVMEYLGYKSIKDPLYRSDKTLMRLSEVVADSKYTDYVTAMETYVDSSEESNGQAYVSSWGEANPGGGKDNIDRYIEKSKKNLIVAKNSLGKIVDLLDRKS